MSDTTYQGFNITMAVINQLLQKYVPYLSVALKVPVLGNFLGGIGGKVSAGLRKMVGAYPDPPDLPAGYHYGEHPALGLRPVTVTLEEYKAIKGYPASWKPTPRLGKPHSGHFTVVANPGVYRARDVVFTDKDNLPVADYDRSTGNFMLIKGFTSDGISIMRTMDVLKYEGKNVSGQITYAPETGTGRRKKPGTVAKNLWNITAGRVSVSVMNQAHRGAMRAQATLTAEKIGKPNLIPAAIVVIVIAVLLLRRK